MKMSGHKQNKFPQNLLNRMQRKAEIKKQIIEILQTTENLAIEDIRKRIGINRNTFNYWINLFEKEKWLHRKFIECEGKDKIGSPKTLVLDKKFIKWQETLRKKNWVSYEAKQLETMLTEKILREIDEQKSSETQHKRLINLFKQFGKEGFGAKFIFLLYDDFVKLDYRLSLTDKGKKALAKLKRHKPK